jgi:hypothetical protein
MGAGASTQELSAEEQAQLAELEAMSPEAQQDLAARAMRGVLSASIAHAFGAAKQAATWQVEALAIPCPRQGQFEAVAAKVAKVPLVGDKLAEGLLGVTQKIAAAFADCAHTIASQPGTEAGFAAQLQQLTLERAVELGRSGSATAHSDFLIEAAEEALRSGAIDAVAAEVLKTHSLTKAWGAAIAAFNSAASKLKQPPMEFDLREFVVSQTFASLAALIRAKEAVIRGGEIPDGADEAVATCFGGGGNGGGGGGGGGGGAALAWRRPVEELVKPLVLVKAGDPRALAFVQPLPPDAAPALDAVAASAGDAAAAAAMLPADAAAAPLRTASGLALVQLDSPARVRGNWSLIGVGVGPLAADAVGDGAVPPLPGAAAAPTAGVGAPLLFSRVGDNFLAARVEGEVKVLDVRHHRYHEGNTLTVCGTAPGADSKRARTWAPLGGKVSSPSQLNTSLFVSSATASRRSPAPACTARRPASPPGLHL